MSKSKSDLIPYYLSDARGQGGTMAKKKDPAGAKTVFKTVFANPYAKWPHIDEQTVKLILDQLRMSLTACLAEKGTVITGINEVSRSIRSGSAQIVFVARDDLGLTLPFTHLLHQAYFARCPLIPLPPATITSLPWTGKHVSPVFCLAQTPASQTLLETIRPLLPAVPVPVEDYSKLRPLAVQRVNTTRKKPKIEKK